MTPKKVNQAAFEELFMRVARTIEAGRADVYLLLLL
jgi:hypothetical protein